MSSSNPPGSSDDQGSKEGGWSADALPPQVEAPQMAPPEEGAEPAPRKKRYYSPNEVMKKKGCIGCGGMGVLLALVSALMAALVALL